MMTHQSLISFILILLGANAMLLQVTALREFMAVFSGNELDLGITLSFWLLAVGAGSAMAKNIAHPRALGSAVLLGGLLAQPLLSLIPHLRPILSLEAGETIPLGPLFAATALILTPACMPIGMQFPLAVRTIGGNTARAYLLEALGALIGGTLYTFLLAGHAPAATVLMASSILSILLGTMLLRKAGFALLVVVPLLATSVLSSALVEMHDEDATLVSRSESRYGVVEMHRAHGQQNVLAGGKFQYSYPDPQTDELRAHLPFTLHPHPRNVLIAGGSPGVALEVLKYPGTEAAHVELDPGLARLSRSLVVPEGAGVSGKRMPAFLIDDARRHIKELAGPRYDLIILNLPEPATANLNRLYTVEFFREARHALRPGGVLTVTLPASFGYVGKRMQAMNGAIYASLRAAFDHVILSSEEYGLLAASDIPIDARPAQLRQRLQERKIGLTYFHAGIFDDAFDEMKVTQNQSRLASITELNTDSRPIAYLFGLLLWADMQQSSPLQFIADHGPALAAAVLAMLVVTGMAAGMRGQAVSFTVFLAGFSSLSFCLVVLLAYQSAFGYVYERIGLLAAAFMAGGAAGAYVSRNLFHPLRALRAAEAATAVLFVAALVFFRSEVVYAALAALAGLAGGVVFVAANKHTGPENASVSAGRLYALDLAGSFLGALLTALLLIPLFGLRNTLLGLVLAKILSLIVLGSVRNEQA